jgi:hypothetical protein
VLASHFLFTDTMNIPDLHDPALAQRLQHKIDRKTKPLARWPPGVTGLQLGLDPGQRDAAPGAAAGAGLRRRPRPGRARRVRLSERRHLADGGELPGRRRRRQRAGAPAWPGADGGGLRRAAHFTPRPACCRASWSRHRRQLARPGDDARAMRAGHAQRPRGRARACPATPCCWARWASATPPPPRCCWRP